MMSLIFLGTILTVIAFVVLLSHWDSKRYLIDRIVCLGEDNITLKIERAGLKKWTVTLSGVDRCDNAYCCNDPDCGEELSVVLATCSSEAKAIKYLKDFKVKLAGAQSCPKAQEHTKNSQGGVK